MTNGRLTTMVSADASFLVSRKAMQRLPQDFSVPLSLNLVAQPIQIFVGLGLLIWTLGYSALVGLGVSFQVELADARCSSSRCRSKVRRRSERADPSPHVLQYDQEPAEADGHRRQTRQASLRGHLVDPCGQALRVGYCVELR